MYVLYQYWIPILLWNWRVELPMRHSSSIFRPYPANHTSIESSRSEDSNGVWYVVSRAHSASIERLTYYSQCILRIEGDHLRAVINYVHTPVEYARVHVLPVRACLLRLGYDELGRGSHY